MYASNQYCELVKVLNDRQWTINVFCEKSSPFHGRPLKVQVDFPENYPQAQSTLTLKEPMETIFHPNISSTGVICHQVVKSSDQSLKVVDKVEGFVALLDCPNPFSPYNGEAGNFTLMKQTNTRKVPMSGMYRP